MLMLGKLVERKERILKGMSSSGRPMSSENELFARGKNLIKRVIKRGD